MAYGARRTDILRSVLGEGAKLAVLGLGLGTVAALGLTGFWKACSSRSGPGILSRSSESRRCFSLSPWRPVSFPRIARCASIRWSPYSTSEERSTRVPYLNS